MADIGPLGRPLVAADSCPSTCCRSSVVEHSIGNGEVDSSILSGSTIFPDAITHRSVFSRRKTPEFCFAPSPSSWKRAQGRPGADGHPRSAARICSARRPHSSIQVTPNTRPSLRSGLTAYTRSPRSRVPSGLRRLANGRCPATRSSPDPSPQGLTVATTVKTTRFRRTQLAPSVPHGAEDLTRFISPWSRLACPTLPRPPHPDPRSLRRTIAPLRGPGWRRECRNSEFR